MEGARFWPRRVRLGLLIGLSVSGFVALCFIPPVPLGSGYHDFADRRTLLGVPNCSDVLSNIPFIVAGIWGLCWLLSRAAQKSFVEPYERMPYLVFFAGVTLTGFGSLWYHLEPGNSRLPWDLLPMTASFMSMVVAILIERVSARAAFSVYVPMIIFGFASVGYWYLTEAQGRGDYRFYLFVQFFPPILLAAIVWLFPPRYTGLNNLIFAFLLFVLAKTMETYDWQIYGKLHFISGHALKHIIAGVACYWVLLTLQYRRPLVTLVRSDSAPRFPGYAPDHLRP
jgi:hypothetical protein